MKSRWEHIDWQEFINYYETHNRGETCTHFNIFIQDVKEMCKEHDYKKPSNLYRTFATDNPAKRDDVKLKLSQKAIIREAKRRDMLISNGSYYKLKDEYLNKGQYTRKYDISLLTDRYDDIVAWYKCHTKEDTLDKFNINTRQLYKICKLLGYTKSEVDIQATIDLKYNCSGGYFTSSDFENKTINKKYMHHSSKSENAWLDSLNIPVSCRQIYVGNKFTVDALCDTIVYEYLGDYWHGNPKYLSKYADKPYYKSYKKEFNDNFNKTLDKFLDLADMGYTIRYIWEGDKGAAYREFKGTLEY